MRIDNSNISFGANFCNYAKVLKYDKSLGKYRPENASFVMIDTDNISDLCALKTILKTWDGDPLTESIVRTASSKAMGDMYYSRNKVFAVTSQFDNFENLNPSNILGIADLRVLNSQGHVFLEHIKVNPYLKGKFGADYKKIGTSMLDSFKSKFFQILLVALDKKYVKDFYKRNGFREYPKGSCHYIWDKKKHS